MDFLVQEVERTIEKFKMLKDGDRIVAGVSGGPDSLCLLHILKALSADRGYKLYAVHLNHMFRGKDADEDAAYVGKICEEWGIPAFIETHDVPAYAAESGLSPEEAGREIRYRLFSEVCEKVGADRIAVAQNLNDQAETVLMRFLRGSGIDGLKGIEPVRDNIIRPLIETERTKVEEYCARNGLSPRIDKTNLEPVYHRNRIRLELIPYLRESFNPNILAAVVRFSQLVRDENDLMEQLAEEAFEKCARVQADRVIIDKDKAGALHPALRRRLARTGIARLCKSLRGFEYKHFESIVELMERSTGAAAELPGGIRAYVSYGNLILAKHIEKADKKCYYKLKYDRDGTFELENGRLSIERKKRSEIGVIKRDRGIIMIDSSKIKNGLAFRYREPGDVFSPIGMKGSKKLKDYFIDEKIPREERDRTALLADGGEIVWIAGGRISDRYKVTEATTDVLVIKYIRGK